MILQTAKKKDQINQIYKVNTNCGSAATQSAFLSSEEHLLRNIRESTEKGRRILAEEGASEEQKNRNQAELKRSVIRAG